MRSLLCGKLLPLLALAVCVSCSKSTREVLRRIPDISVGPISDVTTEVGGQAVFRVVLDTMPLADVIVPMQSTDPTEGTLTATSLTFTPLNWRAPQIVIVTGVNDDLADGNQVYGIRFSPATSKDWTYDGITPLEVPVTNVDDETASISVSAISGATTETGGQATFTVVLNSQPNADVTVNFDSDNIAEGAVDVTSLTFTDLDWNAAQTVTLTGIDDNVDDDDQPYSVVFSATTSADLDYAVITPSGVFVTNVDDETADITVSAVSGPTTETGGQATFTIVLNSQPTADVTVNFDSDDLGEGTVDATSLLFTAVNWNAPQTVTLTGIDDDGADGNQPYSVAFSATTSADAAYAAITPADVLVTNVDDETAGITVSSVSGPTTETGGQATFTVVLNSQPTADVTVNFDSNDLGEGIVDVTSLLFTTANWNAPQTVTLTGIDDDVDDGGQPYAVTFSATTSADAAYAAITPANVLVTNIDDESVGITVSAVSGPTTETGGQATFTVVLNSQPTADVTVNFDSDDLGEGTVDATSLLFTPANWNAPQTVTLTGIDDDGDDGDQPYAVTFSATTSADAAYAAITPANVLVTNVDDESVGITVSAVSGPTTEAGGQATFTVVLNSQPTADVTVNFDSDDLGEGTVDVTSLFFNSGTWNAPQTVTLTGIDDFDADGGQPYAVTFTATTSADAAYAAITPANVLVTNVDDETAGITVSAVSGPTTENGGQATFTVVLDSRPFNTVTSNFDSDDLGEGTVDVTSLLFTTANWNAPQTVTLTGIDDDFDDGGQPYAVTFSATTSADAAYAAITPANVLVTNIDDESVGITVSAVSGPTTEAGGQATFTAVLNSQPTANVTVNFNSNDLGEGTVDVTSLLFTTGNWNAPQTVTLTGIDDNVDDGGQPYAVTFSATSSVDAAYAAITPANVLVTNIDDESVGITVSAVSGPTTENGGQATFTVVLDSQPTADVTVNFDSDDLGEGTVDVTSLLFTSGNWNAPQTVTLTGIDDLGDDGGQPYAVTFSATTSADAAYAAITPANVLVTNVDDETAGITVSAVSGPTTEAGGQATFTVVLDSRPFNTVTVNFDSDDLGEGTVDVTSLLFTTANWNAPQTVTLTGIDDLGDDGGQPYAVTFSATTSADAAYAAITPANVLVTNIDDETAGITVSAVSGPTTEAGGQATFTVVLDSRPFNTVTVNFDSNDLGEGTVDVTSRLFTTGNWNAPQTVTLTGIDDNVDDGGQPYAVTFTATSSVDAAYAAITPANVLVTNFDDETAGITVSAISGPTTETGGQATFTVVLDSRPFNTVTVNFDSNDLGEGTVDVTSLLFTTANWNAPQTVTLTGIDDLGDDGGQPYAVTFSATSSTDAAYAAITPANVLVTNIDDESVGVTVSAVSGPTTEAGGQAAFTVVLDSRPSANVTVNFDSDDLGEGTVDVTSLLFTTANWNAPQTVTLTGVDDFEDDGGQLYAVTFSATTSTDAAYAAITPANVLVTNFDDETAGITVSAVSGPTTEAGGQATLTVVLDSRPTANVTVNFDSNDLGEGTVDVTSLLFTTGNWNAPQTVTLTGVDDFDDDGGQPYAVTFSATNSTDAAYAAITPANVLVTNIDDESVGITVSAVSGPTTEAGGQATFTVVLDSRPAATVTVNFDSNDLGEGTVDVTSLLFTTANWNAPQTVTLTGIDDFDDDGGQPYAVTFSATSSADAAYAAITPANVLVTNIDDETVGITVSAVSGPTTEAGGQATFTVVLDSLPSANVTVNFDSDDLGEGTVDATSLLFTTANWNAPQTVTLTGVDDLGDDGGQPYAVTFSATTSTDAAYAAITPANVLVTNIDDESVGITVSAVSGPTTEAGGQATFTVVLDSRPSANVTVNFDSNDLGEGTVDATFLLFSPGNWNAPQTVTLTGIDDFDDDGGQPYAVTFSATSSTDAAYAAITPANVLVTNIDDETAGITVSAVSGPTTETGGQATFTVVLDSRPSANVTVNFDSNDLGEGTVDVTSLLFTSGNWSVAQTVTLTGVDDVDADGGQPYAVTFSATSSADAAYAAITPANVLVTNVDDETAGITVSAVSGPTNETGGQATFTVVLDSRPSANVTVNFDSNDLGEGTVDVTSLLFTPANWNVAQTVTLTGIDDDSDDGDQPYAVTFSATTSADAAYAAIAPANVLVTNVDDETAGITVSAVSGPTTEAGGQATFTVVLDSRPFGAVTVNFDSNDLGEGTVDVTSLLFTPANWNAPRTVTLTGVDDFDADGGQPYAVTFSATTGGDAAYAAITPANVLVTNVDDETAGITVSAVSGPTTEAGGQATFTVVLDSRPSANVTVNFDSNDLGEGTVDVTSLLFTTGNWNAPQTVTLTGIDDVDADGDQPYAVTFSATTSADAAYAAITPANVLVTNVDDETAGITVSAVSGPTTETGGQATFTVVLDSRPSANVTVNFDSNDLGEGTVDVTSLLFTTANWNAPQTVTLTGIDDVDADGGQPYAVTFSATSSGDAAYAAITPANVLVTNVDDETAGITVSAVSGPTTEAGGQATFTVVLDSRPTANVTVNFDSNDLGEGTVDVTSLLFTAANWSVAQTVTLTGIDDVDADGGQPYAVTFSATTSGDAAYAAITPNNVLVTNVDDETAGITVSAVSGPTTETGGQATFTVVLDSRPTANVTVNFDSNDLGEGTVDVTSLLFTAANWNAPQTVTLTGIDDVDADGGQPYAVTFSATSSSDAAYAAITPANILVTNVDDETAGITVSAVSGPTTETGGQATFTVVLDSRPTANVTVNFNSNDLGEGTVDVTSLLFTTGNWNAPQTVTLTGIDDFGADGDQPYAVTFSATSSADAAYAAITPANVLVTNVDDETAGITVSAVSGPTTEAGGQATFSVVLDSMPFNTVTVNFDSNDLGEGTVDSTSLLFTSGNWNAPQTVTLTGIDDVDADGDQPYAVTFSATSSGDAAYAAITPANVLVTNFDDETAGITVSAVSGPTTEAGGQATFTVVLDSRPAATVTVNFDSNDLGEGTVDVTSLLFTTGNWNAPQTVTLTGVDDFDADGGQPYAVTFSATSSADAAYAAITPGNVLVTNVDDETAGITVSAVSGPTTEAGGQATFTVVLDSRPTANVTVNFDSNDLGEGTVDVTSLVFTTANWNAPQTVTLTGIDDFDDDGGQPYAVTFSATSSADAAYAAITPNNVLVTNVDDETAGITVSAVSGPTTEAGGQATFTVVLDSRPAATVTVNFDSNDLGEGTVDVTSLVFTTGNWNAPQTVTLTGIDDFDDDGGQPYAVTFSATSSADAAYAAITPNNVLVTNVDDETAGITVSAVSGPTTEAGGQATFTVVLDSRPAATVTVNFDSNDLGEGTVDVTSLLFTTANWNAPQTVTLTGIDDFDADGGQPYAVTFSATTSADAAYAAITPANVLVTNVDDETAGITVSHISGATTEAGGQATFTVVLDSRPSANVTVNFDSNDLGEGTVDVTSLLFTTANWNAPQTVTLTGIDDVLVDGDQTYSIVFTPTTSADSDYSGLTPNNIPVTNVDDD